MEGSLKTKVVSGVIWKFIESISAQGVSFIISVILARLLMPEDFGVIALVMVFINLANVFVTSGFSTALIQKKDATETDFSTIFYCSFAVSILMYFVLFFSAPLIASFYRNNSLTLVIRVFSLRLPMSVYNSIQQAYISRKMMFRKSFLASLLGTITSGIIGIIMAYAGLGIWALITQYFVGTIVGTIVLSIIVPWHLQFKFSKESAIPMMKYGSKILIADLSGTFFGQLRNLIVGKFYSSADLAYYNKGGALPSLVSSNLSSSISAVLFPAMSDYSLDIKYVKAITRRSIKMMAYLLIPALVGVALVSQEVVLILYTDKWAPIIPFVKILSLSTMIGAIGIVPLQTFKAIGRSDVVVKLEIYKKPVYILLLLIGVRESVLMIAITMLLYDIYGSFVNLLQLHKYIGYKFKELAADLLPIVLMTVVMTIFILIVPNFENLFASLFLKVLIGIVIYGGLSIILKYEMYTELKQIIGKFIKR